MDLATLLEPVSPDEPCGPDLDADGDPEYFQAVSRAEGLLPAAFFTRDDEGRLVPFDRGAIAFPAELKSLDGLLGRTRDLRLLTIRARLSALNRDLGGLAEAFSAVAALLAERWSDVHPRGDGSDYAFRGAVLQALDDMPTLVLPLQHVPIATSRRLGSITWRTVMIANGEVPAPEGETPPDRGTLDRALAETEIDDLVRVRDRLRVIKTAADAIRDKTLAELGFEGAVVLDRLPALVGRMLEAVEPILLVREPGGAPPPAGGGEESSAASAGAGTGAATHPASAPRAAFGALRSKAEAHRLLAAAASYFARAEPSSPAEPLVRQALALVGRSFVDVIRALLPTQAEETRIALGSDRPFGLSLQQLSDLSGGPDGSDPSGGPEGSGGPDGEGAGDGQEAEPPRIDTRSDALAALATVAGFYRVAEPPSPIPLLLDRAAGLSERDFMTVLKDVLPSLFVRPE